LPARDGAAEAYDPSQPFELASENRRDRSRVSPPSRKLEGELIMVRKTSFVLIASVAGLAACATTSAQAAWPKKYTGVGLKADSNEVAVESLGVPTVNRGMRGTPNTMGRAMRGGGRMNGGMRGRR
jgi:hypothetical protein